MCEKHSIHCVNHSISVFIRTIDRNNLTNDYAQLINMFEFK